MYQGQTLYIRGEGITINTFYFHCKNNVAKNANWLEILYKTDIGRLHKLAIS